MFFAKNIKYLRKKSGISQEKLAAMLGLSRTTVTNYESGFSTPDYTHLIRIASIFTISIDSLLSRNMTMDSGDSYVADGESGDIFIRGVRETDPVYHRLQSCELCNQKDITIKALQDSIETMKNTISQNTANRDHLFVMVSSLQQENAVLHKRLDSVDGKANNDT